MRKACTDMPTLAKEDWPMLAAKVHPDLLYRIARVMKKQAVTSRPTWLIAVLEKALAEQEAAGQ